MWKKFGMMALTGMLALSIWMPAYATAATVETGTIVYGVNFREQPSLSGDQIRMLKKGEKVQILDRIGKYWLKVKDQYGQIGYISSSGKYVKLNSAGNSSGESVIKQQNENNHSANTSIATLTASEKAKKVIEAGMKYLGTPYEYGSDRSTTTTFDCSDFVRQAFKDALGITLPPDSRQQGEYVKQKGDVHTDWRELEPGDLMFFMSYRGPKASDYKGINKSTQRITHVGIYLGDGKILHTYSKESGGVRVDSIVGKHWEYRFLFGGSAF